MMPKHPVYPNKEACTKKSLILCFVCVDWWGGGNLGNKYNFCKVKIIRRIHLVHSHHEAQDKCIKKGVLWQELVIPPWPSKIPRRGEGGGVQIPFKIFLNNSSTVSRFLYEIKKIWVCDDWSIPSNILIILQVEGKGSEIDILTKAYGDVRDKIGKKSETGT